jgi:hypothetical protein
MPEPDRAGLERRLDAGKWLRLSEVAHLLDASRASVDRWVRDGRFRYRRRGPRGDRFLHPEDVRRELDEYRRERRNGVAEPGDGSAPPG